MLVVGGFVEQQTTWSPSHPAWPPTPPSLLPEAEQRSDPESKTGLVPATQYGSTMSEKHFARFRNDVASEAKEHWTFGTPEKRPVRCPSQETPHVVEHTAFWSSCRVFFTHPDVDGQHLEFCDVLPVISNQTLSHSWFFRFVQSPAGIQYLPSHVVPGSDAQSASLLQSGQLLAGSDSQLNAPPPEGLQSPGQSQSPMQIFSPPLTGTSDSHLDASQTQVRASRSQIDPKASWLSKGQSESSQHPSAGSHTAASVGAPLGDALGLWLGSLLGAPLG